MAFGAEVLKELPPEPLEVIAPKVRDGDILLCSATDPFSRLIGWSTRSVWSHVAVAYRWPQVNRLLAFECVQRIGVRAVAMERFISETSGGQRPYPGRIILARHADAPGVRAFEPLAHFAVDRMGDRFSPMEIVKIATRIVVGRLDRRMPPILEARDEFICSEYVEKCIERVGLRIEWDGLGFIAPADFADDPKVHAIAQFQTR
jgi:hypothetical protein